MSLVNEIKREIQEAEKTIILCNAQLLDAVKREDEPSWTNNYEECMERLNSPEVKAYREFMDNPDNIMECDDCPENTGNSPLPCGQQNCWVACHCIK